MATSPNRSPGIELLAAAAVDVDTLTSTVLPLDDVAAASGALCKPERIVEALIATSGPTSEHEILA
jgi:hypothetical protein